SSSRTSGVRSTVPAMRSRAARISASGTGSRGFIASLAPPPELPPHPRAAPAPHPGEGGRRRPVLHRHAQGLAERGLVARAPARAATEQELADLALDVARFEGALLHRDQEVAGLVQRRLAPVDEDARALDGVGVELARVLETRARGVDVAAGCEPAAL